MSVLAIVLLVLGGVLVLTIVTAVVAFLVLRPTGVLPGPDPTTTQAETPAPTPTADLGPIGREAAVIGLSCALELSDPLIHGCYGRAGDGSRSLRWQGPLDQPTALDVYVFSDTAGFEFATELSTVLGALSKGGVWSTDDLTAVQERSELAEGKTRYVTTSWGRVTLTQSKYSLSLTGARPGETAQKVTPKLFPQSMAEMERLAANLGYTCDTSTTSSDDYSTCTDAEDNYVSISTYESPTVESLFATLKSAAGPQKLADLVTAASPDDGAALAPLIIQGAATEAVSHQAANGWIVRCTKDDDLSCSVYGVGWE